MFLYHFRIYNMILFILTELVPIIMEQVEKYMCHVKMVSAMRQSFPREMAVLHEGRSLGAVWG